MTSRERVLTAFDHEEPERVPIDMPFTPEAAETVIRWLSEEKHIETDSPGLAAVMGHDILVASHGVGLSYYSQETAEYTCEWGIGWRWVTLPNGGRYTEMVHHPLGDASRLSSYSCPDPHKSSRYDRMRELLEKHGETHAIVGSMGSILFEPAWHLRGFETFLTDLVVNRHVRHLALLVQHSAFEIGDAAIGRKSSYHFLPFSRINPVDYRRIVLHILARAAENIEELVVHIQYFRTVQPCP